MLRTSMLVLQKAQITEHEFKIRELECKNQANTLKTDTGLEKQAIAKIAQSFMSQKVSTFRYKEPWNRTSRETQVYDFLL